MRGLAYKEADLLGQLSKSGKRGLSTGGPSWPDMGHSEEASTYQAREMYYSAEQ